MRAYFGLGKILDVANDMIEGCYFDEYDDVMDCIADSVDGNLIYTEDQWTVIEPYSDPSDPMSISEAMDRFVEDLARFVEDSDEEE